MADLASLFITPIAHRATAEAAIEAIGGGSVSLTMRIAKDPATLTWQTAQTHCGMNHGGLSGQHIAEWNKAKQAGILPPSNLDTADPIAWGEGGLPTESEALAMFAASDFYFKNSNSTAANFAAQNMGPDGYYIIPDPAL